MKSLAAALSLFAAPAVAHTAAAVHAHAEQSAAHAAALVIGTLALLAAGALGYAKLRK